jgi:hypothetical protein
MVRAVVLGVHLKARCCWLRHSNLFSLWKVGGVGPAHRSIAGSCIISGMSVD